MCVYIQKGLTLQIFALLSTSRRWVFLHMSGISYGSSNLEFRKTVRNNLSIFKKKLTLLLEKVPLMSNSSLAS